MPPRVPISPQRHIEKLLSGATRFPGLRRELYALVSSDKATYLPLLVSAAAANRDAPGDEARGLLIRILRKSKGLELPEAIYDLFPLRSPLIAPVAVEVTGRLLSGLMAAGEPDSLTAYLLNNLAEWKGNVGDHKGAITAASAAVQILEGEYQSDPKHLDDYIVALNTLAKAADAGGETKAAEGAAKLAVHFSRKLPVALDGKHLRTLAQSLHCLANRLATKSRALALEPAHEALRVLESLPGEMVADDIALAHASLSNILDDLGRYAEAGEHARAAHELYLLLVARDTDEFLDRHLAAANSYCHHLGLQGDLQGAVALARRSVDYLETLAKKTPHRFSEDLIAGLCSYSSWCAESGDHGEALIAARRAYRVAGQLRTLRDGRACRLKSFALQNLFNREYEQKDYGSAARRASRGLTILRTFPSPSPEDRVQIAQHLRNLAEAKRMTARSQAKLDQAVQRATEALEELDAIDAPWPPSVLEARSYALLSLAQCLNDAGRPQEALAKAQEATAIRRRMASEKHPESLAKLAHSLQQESRFANPKQSPSPDSS